MLSRKGAPRLQLVTANRLEDEEAAVKRVARRLGLTVETTTNDPKIPTDTRLRRMTMYRIQKGARRAAFLDVYNTGEYEVVPAAPPTSAGARVGTFFVRLRYLLVDIWTMLLIHEMKMADGRFTRTVLNRFIAEFERTSAAYERAFRAATPDTLAALFPTKTDDYIGRYVDPAIAEKRQNYKNAQREYLKTGSRRRGYWPYYPARKAKTARR